MGIKKIVGALLFFAPTLSSAFFCPTNFNQIAFGSSPNEITQQCGKPDQQESATVLKEVPEEWSYFISQAVATGTLSTAQGTLKTVVTFDTSGKAINISVNGIGVGASTICGPNIQLGDTKQLIKAACGKPSFVNSQRNNAPTAGTIAGGAYGTPQQSSRMTTFIYHSNPPAKLIFINDKLVRTE